ncbi:MAG: LLM class flavin-dependent oxidoreductase [Actinobacteria bacterium]|nr:LLM class flavin-dependent oxidoreductase [Actinomycetota bacterium]
MTRRWGLTVPLEGVRLAELREHVERAEAAGYTDLWSSETVGPDGFTPLAMAVGWTSEMRLGTGVVGVFQRGPALLAQEAAALTDASGGRFVLGLGAANDRIVEHWNGIPFKKPLSRVRETLDFLDVALTGERAENGFRLETKPLHPTPVVLAALRGKMLALAVERASGALTNWLPLRGLAKVRESVADAPPGFELLCRLFCMPGTREEMEPKARKLFSIYITVPVYREFFRWLGYEEEIAAMAAAWEAGDRKGAAAAAPWELVEETFLIGSPEEIVERVEAFVEGGVTLPVLMPMVKPERLAEVIPALAPPG